MLLAFSDLIRPFSRFFIGGIGQLLRRYHAHVPKGFGRVYLIDYRSTVLQNNENFSRFKIFVGRYFISNIFLLIKMFN